MAKLDRRRRGRRGPRVDQHHPLRRHRAGAAGHLHADLRHHRARQPEGRAAQGGQRRQHGRVHPEPGATPREGELLAERRADRRRWPQAAAIIRREATAEPKTPGGDRRRQGRRVRAGRRADRSGEAERRDGVRARHRARRAAAGRPRAGAADRRRHRTGTLDPSAEPKPTTARPRARGRPAPRAARCERKRAERRRGARARRRARRPADRRRSAPHDPLPRGRARAAGRALAWRWRCWSGRSAVHVGDRGARVRASAGASGSARIVRQEVNIEVREHEAAAAAAAAARDAARARAGRKARRPSVAPRRAARRRAAAAAEAPPPRVVGLSLESTTEGGGGPSFAVGNTREGKTAERARRSRRGPHQARRRPPTPSPPRSTRPPAASPSPGSSTHSPKRKQPERAALPRDPEEPGNRGRRDGDGEPRRRPARSTSVKILKESPYPEFNEAAREHAR